MTTSHLHRPFSVAEVVLDLATLVERGLKDEETNHVDVGGGSAHDHRWKDGCC